MRPLVSFPRLRAAARMRWPWIVGLTATGLVIILFAFELRAAKAEEATSIAKQRTVERLLRSSFSVNAHLRSDPTSPRMAPERFLSTVTSDMHMFAQQDGLVVSDLSYKPVDDAASPNIARVDITARFRGGYLPMRKLVADMLSAYDSLALESISMRRDRSTDLMLDIEVHLTLFCQKQA